MALTTKFKRACAEWGPVGSYLCGLLYVVKAYYLLIQFFNAYFTYLSKITDSSTIYQGCVNRVSSDQAALFDPSNLQSNLSLYWGDDTSTFNSTLCDLGFVGNSDIYGLGVRSGLYIQWVTSLLANHLLREESTALMRSYLIFHIALCIAVAVLTFQKNCTFVVEIVLLYYLVYGGFICVFSRPNLGDFEPATVGLHWSQVVLILSFFAMVIHVVWFVVFGHFSLPNMPCETTIFFFGPVKGPWMDVWLLWLAVNLLAIIFLVVNGTTLWLCAFCFIYAMKILVSVVQSVLYRDLFLRVRYRSVVQLQSASLRCLRFSEILEWLAAQPDSIRNKYGSALSRYFRAYTMSRPVHGQQRRCIPVFKELCVRH